MIKPSKLNFLTSGIPLSTKKPGTLEGLKQVKKLGLDGMELEFVHSIHVTKEKAPEVNKIAKENDLMISCHAPYYINLNAKEKPKWHAGISYIVQSAKISYLCGGYSVCFHPAYYMKQNPKDVYNKVKEAISLILKELKKDDVEIWVRPETAGRVAQFGNINEIINLSSEFENVLPCIDWSHLHAYSNGKYNSKEEFREVLALMEKKLGKNALNNVHFHCQGVNYSEKGEKNHVNLQDSDLNFKDLVKIWKEFKLKGIIVCESPNVEKDALLLKEIYNKN
ncbi:MAG: TIM barrel protein [Nanoarchaeota archaeon]